jgi:hypothetical protein
MTLSSKNLEACKRKCFFSWQRIPKTTSKEFNKGLTILLTNMALSQKPLMRSKHTALLCHAVSQKNVRIKTYSCTESGIFYALTRDPSADPVKIFEAYKSEVSWCKSLRQLYDVWGHEHFMAYFRDVGDVLPIIQKKGFDEALPYLFFKAVKLTHSIDKKTRNRNVKEALKLFPENKEMLKEWRKNIDEVL